MLGTSRARAKAKERAVAKVAPRAAEAGAAEVPGVVAKGKGGPCTIRVQLDVLQLPDLSLGA